MCFPLNFNPPPPKKKPDLCDHLQLCHSEAYLTSDPTYGNFFLRDFSLFLKEQQKLNTEDICGREQRTFTKL